MENNITKDDNIIKIGSLVYPFLLDVVNKYQDNYHGDDKMTREYMMDEIKRFK